jgi:hypothetical protein
MDMRDPIAIQYVGGAQAPVHVRPDDKSRVVTRYQHSESVPVLARKGEWAEVRTAMGSGWVHQSDLVSAGEGAQSKSEPTPRFEHAPSPVTAPGVHGTVYIMAKVNTDGDVISTAIVTDTTNSPGLAARNAAALQRSKFYPIVIRGERKPFEYYYRVDY